MNSDEIERSQRASAMTAPEVSRSTETLVSTALGCASTLKNDRRDASRGSDFHDAVFVLFRFCDSSPCAAEDVQI